MLQGRHGPFKQGDFARGILVPGAGNFLRPVQVALNGFEIAECQFRFDDGNVVEWTDLARDVNDIVILETPHHVCNGVGFTNVGQELVAQAFPL